MILLGAASVGIAASAPPMVHRAQETATAAPALSDQQRMELKEVVRLNKLASAGVAIRVARIAKAVYTNLLADHPNAKTGRVLSAKLRRTAGELLTLHGQAMRQALAILTLEQRHYIRDRMGKPDIPADLLELIVKVYGLDD